MNMKRNNKFNISAVESAIIDLSQAKELLDVIDDIFNSITSPMDGKDDFSEISDHDLLITSYNLHRDRNKISTLISILRDMVEKNNGEILTQVSNYFSDIKQEGMNFIGKDREEKAN